MCYEKITDLASVIEFLLSSLFNRFKTKQKESNKKKTTTTTKTKTAKKIWSPSAGV